MESNETPWNPNRKDQEDEVRQNFKAFQKLDQEQGEEHKGKFALMKNRQIVEIFESHTEAYKAGQKRFPNAPFSIQEFGAKPQSIPSVFSPVRVESKIDRILRKAKNLANWGVILALEIFMTVKATILLFSNKAIEGQDITVVIAALAASRVMRMEKRLEKRFR